jgi:hypothetical protein
VLTKALVAPIVLGGLLVANPVLGQGDTTGPKQPKLGAPKKPAPASLEDLLAKALKQNPDILVAEAKVHEAEAELNRTRQVVLAKVVMLNAEIDAAKFIFQEADIRVKRLNELRARGGGVLVTDEEMGTAQVTMLKYKAELARKEGELPLLIGKKTAGLGVTLRIEASPAEPKALDLTTPTTERMRLALTTPTTERMRLALATSVKVEFTNSSLDEVLNHFQSKIKDVGVNLALAAKEVSRETRVKASLAVPVSLLAALQLLEDTQSLRFIVREYGIVAVDANNVPPGSLSVTEFAKQTAKKSAQ